MDRTISAKPVTTDETAPIRSGQLTDESRLYEAAAELAHLHAVNGRIGKAGRGVPLTRTLAEDFAALKQCHAGFSAAAAQGKEIAPAAEWLVDNFPRIEQHFQQVVQDFPASYARRLPCLIDGPRRGRTRIYEIARHYVAETDSRFSAPWTIGFVGTYQSLSPLTIGELWAFAIHMRALLVENAARISARTLISQQARDGVDKLLAEALEGKGHRWDMDAALGEFPDHARHSLLVHLLRRLRGRMRLDPDYLSDVLSRLAASGYSPEDAIAEENARQVANNLTMQNIFKSFIAVAELDWETWFASVSRVDRRLSETASYGELDSSSKTLYRNAVEDLARHSGKTELEVTERAIVLAAGEPGQALLGSLRPDLERDVGYRQTPLRALRRAAGRLGLAGYVGSIALLAVLFAAFALTAAEPGLAGGGVLLLLGLLVSFPAVESAVALVNYALTQILRPVLLPGFAFKSGIPPQHKAMIAVPAMMSTYHGIEELLDRLEDHFLTNRDDNLCYALLTDWNDADVQLQDGDPALLAAMVRGVAELNTRHATTQFMLFHRRRQWNASQGRWMGWERKRGKLAELNRLLRGKSGTSFIAVPPSVPGDIAYVIVLDADTQMPAGTARKLVGKMAHPLNQPAFDAASGRVDSGYGIIQPRVTVSLPETGRGSPYRRIFARNPGLDPYVFAVSDIYQDVFGEGSFVGKGIYRIDTLEAALKERVPDNTLLSHDLLEGNLARSGLASDVQVVEDFPDRYLVDAARHQRWTRGDWQLLRWLLPPARGLTPLGWWKMADNLRRSLTPLATLAAMVAGWMLLPAAGAIGWTAYLMVLVFVPTLLPVLAGSSLRKEQITTASEVRTAADDVATALVVMLVRVTMMVHQSWLQAEAIIVTLYRMIVSRRNLLEWTPAAQVGRDLNPGLPGTYALMAASPLLGVVLLAVHGAGQALSGAPSLSAAALPFAVAWLLAPLLAYVMSLPRAAEHRHAALRAGDETELRRIALATWRYFDVHVTATNNMLPPDNLQEHPAPVVATRTSPTNIGVYLLSAVSACDLGWIGIDEAERRVAETLEQAAKLETHRGHLFNWHDTTTLRPLEPRYVSSVDSGNFACHLIATANALERWAETSGINGMRLAGIGDCARQVDECILAISQLHRRDLTEAGHIREQIAVLIAAVAELADHIELVPLRILSLTVQINAIGQSALRLIDRQSTPQTEDCSYWMAKLRQAADAVVREAMRDDRSMIAQRERLLKTAAQCRAMAYGMDFSFLMNRQRELLSIGYRVGEETLDESCYDLFASEAVLTSYFAIAKGDLGVEHWQKLGRPVTEINRAACLVSWSGSMFEYLMPHIVMRAPEETLYHQTLHLAVWRHMAYGRENRTPWGISESAYSARDLAHTYQYSSFGVPGLGLKRGLGQNLVIAPYASALAAMINPPGASANYRHLAKCGARGRFGFYEAIDYTPERLPVGQTLEVIKAYFAHHQGMTVASIYNAVSGGRLRAYFHAENIMRAAELLLQERPPHHLPVKTVTVADVPNVVQRRESRTDDLHIRIVPGELEKPATATYSNGRMSAVIAADGSAALMWNGIAVNRWRADPHAEPGGLRLMLRRGTAGALHPVFHGRFARRGESHAVAFHQDKAEFFFNQSRLECTVEYFLAPDSDAEVRRLTITNHSGAVLSVEWTSFMELALARPEADSAHPAFSKLFVRTEFDVEAQAVLATRRRRQDDDPAIWTGHFVTLEGTAAGALAFETDRASFLGRGNCFETADAFRPGAAWRGATGHVLDPAVAFRQSVVIQPHDKARIYLWTVAAASRDEVVALVRRHRMPDSYERIRTLAWTHARIGLRHISVSATEAARYQSLTAPLVYSLPDFRPRPERIAATMGPQSALWPYSISGRRPMVVVRIDDANDLPVVQQLLKAQDYWNLTGLPVDLVILNDSPSSYTQDLQWNLDDMVFRARAWRPSGSVPDEQIFLLRSLSMTPEAVNLLVAAAHMVFVASHGSLRLQAAVPARKAGAAAAARQPARAQLPIGPQPAGTASRPPQDDLLFDNGFGGFDRKSLEYVIHHSAVRMLPAPWINVIANERFGTLCSAEGGGYTWFLNSKERQITPWSNDPVADPPGECFYVQNAADQKVSSPTVLPLGRRRGRLTTRHGFGHTVHEAEENGLRLRLTTTVDVERAVKLSRLVIVNRSRQAQQLTVSFLGELVMGRNRQQAAHFVTSAHDAESGALFVQNRWDPEFGDTIVYCGMLEGQDVASSDRAAAMGPCGTAAWPFGLLSGSPLQATVGGGLDPGLVLQKSVALKPGESAACTVVLGAASDAAEARRCLAELRAAGFAAVWDGQKRACAEITGRFHVETPDASFNTVMNGWLIYQALVGRFYARSGFYQASGAYGFRDQLQDSMAFAYVRPDLARRHILRAAARQFAEGDVQHWWLPGTGAGVRTRISDDTVWLAYCTAHYVAVTGDHSILDESVPFLEGRMVAEGEHDAFYVPAVAERHASLYDHCVLALSRALAGGPHGLPLMGTGDWNDGMNKVGEQGQGESIWLGWFVCATLGRFGDLAIARGDNATAARWDEHSQALSQALDRTAWDGEWYRRAYFDDGSPLGTAQDAECQIDSIAQSWAVLSGVADATRARAAMQAVQARLIDEDARIVRLFTPPLDRHVPNAGYIQSYPPGVRENGGQYSHAAVWAIFAYCRLGEAEQAARLFALINPVNHALSESDAALYRVEPYVVAADVYGAPPYVGRGGWTWYTGAAGWLFRAGLEAILGLRRSGRMLSLEPCLPAAWPGFTLTIAHGGKKIRLVVTRDGAAGGGRQLQPREAVDLDTTADGETLILRLRPT